MIKLTMIGRLGGNAEVRDAAGRKVISFSVAHSESYTDRSGVRQEKTTWVKCSLWRDEGRTTIAEYLKKGTQVYVEGMPSVTSYQKQDGTTGVSLELNVISVELLGGKQDAAPAVQDPASAQGAYGPPVAKPSNPAMRDDPNEVFVDDLPF